MAGRTGTAIWSPEALVDLDEIWNYYERVAGTNTAEKIAREIGAAVATIEDGCNDYRYRRIIPLKRTPPYGNRAVASQTPDLMHALNALTQRPSDPAGPYLRRYIMQVSRCWLHVRGVSSTAAMAQEIGKIPENTRIPVKNARMSFPPSACGGMHRFRDAAIPTRSDVARMLVAVEKLLMLPIIESKRLWLA
jgi:plasmid stabilization system protein ParE